MVSICLKKGERGLQMFKGWCSDGEYLLEEGWEESAGAQSLPKIPRYIPGVRDPKQPEISSTLENMDIKGVRH